jgi:hypothetical protein
VGRTQNSKPSAPFPEERMVAALRISGHLSRGLSFQLEASLTNASK